MNWKSKAECEAPAEAPSSGEVVDRLRYACERLYEECHKPFADEMALVIEEAIAALAVPGKAEGYVLVPKEPTEVMLKAAFSLKSPCVKYRSIYRAMIAAAPDKGAGQ